MKQKPWCDKVKVKKVKVSKTRLKAKWIDISDATTDDGGRDWHLRDLQCSNCKVIYHIRFSYGFTYCPDCGAKMER